jgi:hypothetical protein
MTPAPLIWRQTCRGISPRPPAFPPGLLFCARGGWQDILNASTGSPLLDGVGCLPSYRNAAFSRQRESY